MKKLVIFLFILIIILFIGYQQQKNETVECWWGVIYPSLSFIGFEDNEEIQYSSIAEIKPNNNNNKIKYKSFILEWLKENFVYKVL